MSKDFFWSKIVDIYRQVFSLLRKNPTILFLFIIIGLVDLVALSTLFFAPSPPVSTILAPIIRNIWNDRYLHYPENFILLPKLFGHAHFLILSVFGVFVSGVVIKKIEAFCRGYQRVSTMKVTGQVMRKYFSLLIAWLGCYAVFAVAMKLVMPYIPRNLWAQLGVALGIGVIVQSLLAFVLPAVMLRDKGFLKGVWEGLVLGTRNLLLTGTVILLPMVLIIIVSYFKGMTPYFIRVCPESVLWVLIASIFVSVAVDLLITSTTTLLFLKVRVKKS